MYHLFCPVYLSSTQYQGNDNEETSNENLMGQLNQHKTAL
jgi:hypothetical protein